MQHVCRQLHVNENYEKKHWNILCILLKFHFHWENDCPHGFYVDSNKTATLTYCETKRGTISSLRKITIFRLQCSSKLDVTADVWGKLISTRCVCFANLVPNYSKWFVYIIYQLNSFCRFIENSPVDAFNYTLKI